VNPYVDMKDEELIRQLRKGDTEITDYIMDKYKYLVRKRANAMFLIGGENEDLIQEGMIGLFKAIRDFKEERESSFYHFADLCISRQIYNAVEASGRKKHQPLNSYISLSEQDAENSSVFPDMFLNMDSGNPEQLLIDRENMAIMEAELNRRLSKMEKEVMYYYLKGLNYRQIAEIMKKQPKAIDNALQRIKGKLSNIEEGLAK